MWEQGGWNKSSWLKSMPRSSYPEENRRVLLGTSFLFLKKVPFLEMKKNKKK